MLKTKTKTNKIKFENKKTKIKKHEKRFTCFKKPEPRRPIGRTTKKHVRFSKTSNLFLKKKTF